MRTEEPDKDGVKERAVVFRDRDRVQRARVIWTSQVLSREMRTEACNWTGPLHLTSQWCEGARSKHTGAKRGHVWCDWTGRRTKGAA